MNRRRMMLERRGKFFVFSEGSAALENTAGAAELNDYASIKEGFINLEGAVQYGRTLHNLRGNYSRRAAGLPEL